MLLIQKFVAMGRVSTNQEINLASPNSSVSVMWAGLNLQAFQPAQKMWMNVSQHLPVSSIHLSIVLISQDLSSAALVLQGIQAMVSHVMTSMNVK